MPFTERDTERLTAQIQKSEGLRLAAYRCTAGRLTIGFGHNCDTSPVPGVSKVGDRITREQADDLLSKDLSAVVWEVRKALPWVTSLEAPRQAVLYDMAFNMGTRGLLGFRNTLRFIEAGDYKRAARNMLQSKWADDVGRRADRLADQMATGEWR